MGPCPAPDPNRVRGLARRRGRGRLSGPDLPRARVDGHLLVPEGHFGPADDLASYPEGLGRVADPVLYLAPERVDPGGVGHLGQDEDAPGLVDRPAELRGAGAPAAAGLDDRLRGQDLPVRKRADGAHIVVPLLCLPEPHAPHPAGRPVRRLRLPGAVEQGAGIRVGHAEGAHRLDVARDRGDLEAVVHKGLEPLLVIADVLGLVVEEGGEVGIHVSRGQELAVVQKGPPHLDQPSPVVHVLGGEDEIHIPEGI